MRYEYILLDLDGTVADSAQGVTNSVAYALEKLGFHVEDKSALMKFIGPPLNESLREFYGLDDEAVAKGIEYYREYYTDRGIFEVEIYEGIKELLSVLNERGLKAVLATSKPDVYAKRILEHFGIDKAFYFIGGSTLDGSRNTKADVLKYIIDTLNIDDLSKAVLVGDRKHDIIGAHEVGIECISILYGYGNEAEFKQYGTDYIIDTPQSVADFLIQ